MVSMRNLALAASSIAGLASAAPAELTQRQTYVPGTINNTQEFYLQIQVSSGDAAFNGLQLAAYHTGAGLADPVFVSAPGDRAYLNGTNLQLDIADFDFGLTASEGDDNYARWEPSSIAAGYGVGPFVNNGADGIEVDSPEFGGWLVCEWFHGIDIPQLFQLVSGYDAQPTVIPSSCAIVKLIPEYI